MRRLLPRYSRWNLYFTVRVVAYWTVLLLLFHFVHNEIYDGMAIGFFYVVHDRIATLTGRQELLEEIRGDRAIVERQHDDVMEERKTK